MGGLLQPGLEVIGRLSASHSSLGQPSTERSYQASYSSIAPSHSASLASSSSHVTPPGIM